MPKYTVTVQQQTTRYFEKSITAKDEEAAQAKVEELLGEPEKFITEKKGWTPTDSADDEWTIRERRRGVTR